MNTFINCHKILYIKWDIGAPVGLSRSSYFLWWETFVACIDDLLQNEKTFPEHREEWMMRNDAERSQGVIANSLSEAL